MKKIFLLLLSVVVIASCSLQPETGTPDQMSKIPAAEDIQRLALGRHDELALLHLAASHEVPLQELERQVNLFLATGAGASRGAGSAGSAITGVKKVPIAEGKGFSANTAPGRTVTGLQEPAEIPFYLFSVENIEEQTVGYALACGDSRLPGVIAVTEDGNFEDEHPFKEVFLADLADYIMITIETYNSITEADIEAALKNLGNKQADSRLMAPVILSTTVVDWLPPLTKTKWGQGDPYNNVLNSYSGGSYYTGCVATAVAQIMAFHEWPQAPLPSVYHPTIGVFFKEFFLDNTRRLFSNMSYDWVKMKNEVTASKDPYKYEIGVLMFQVGCALNMRYYGDVGSGAPSNNVPSAMALMGYQTGPLVNYNYTYIVQSVNNRLPVYISAYSLDEMQTGLKGHAWVIDSYQNNIEPVEILPGVFYSMLIPYVHCNFGWDAECDGWYYSGIFDTAAGPVNLAAGDVKSSKPRAYHFQQQIIPHIQPIR